MGKKTLKKAWGFILLAVFMMALIFVMSSMDGGESSQLSGFLVHWLERVIPMFHTLSGAAYEGAHELLSWLVRKGAHFTEYAFLGFFWASAFHSWPSSNTRRKSFLLRGFLLALLIGVCYAGTDEYHQAFTAGRIPALLDVGIDSAGVLVGALFSTLFAACFRSRSAVRG